MVCISISCNTSGSKVNRIERQNQTTGTAARHNKAWQACNSSSFPNLPRILQCNRLFVHIIEYITTSNEQHTWLDDSFPSLSLGTVQVPTIDRRRHRHCSDEQLFHARVARHTRNLGLVGVVFSVGSKRHHSYR